MYLIVRGILNFATNIVHIINAQQKLKAEHQTITVSEMNFKLCSITIDLNRFKSSFQFT